MGDYFKPWRRKIGVVMLFVTCMFASAWIRSYSVQDGLNIRVSDTTRYFFYSSIHGLVWENASGIDPKMNAAFPAILVSSQDANKNAVTLRNASMQMCRFGDFQFSGDDSVLIFVLIRYWTVVIPLTLLSAYLLLSKPRKSTPKKITEPIPSEGT